MCISVLPACNVCACMPDTCGGSDQDIRYPGTGFTDSCKSCPEGLGNKLRELLVPLAASWPPFQHITRFLGGGAEGFPRQGFSVEPWLAWNSEIGLPLSPECWDLKGVFHYHPAPFLNFES